MPRDSAGNYSLPDGYLAVAGETIQPSQHNPPLEDIAQALTGSLPRNGSAPMGAALKLTDGTAAQPSLTFNSATGTGFYLTSSGNIGFAVGGVQVAEFASTGLIGTVPIGAGMDYWLPPPAPAGWLLCYAQACPSDKTALRAALVAAGNPYGTFEGNPLLPDKRGRASFGKDDMGGTSANRITNQSGGWAANVLGAAGGTQVHTLTIPQMPIHTPTGIVTVSYPPHTYLASSGGASYQAGSSATAFNTNTSTPTTPPSAQGFAVQMDAIGAGSAHNNLPPGITSNYIIYAGV